ncbi:hypothetical protein N0V88_007735 [Collariella sp. IMI 366227]|nr:hypothetical protein N0V88_007735 [Collariella sp. IMI 366227]
MATFNDSYARPATLQCQESISAAISLITLTHNHPSIPSNTCLFTLLNQCFTKIQSIFALDDYYSVLSSPSTLERILTATFDTASLGFVTEKSVRIIAGLDDHDKISLYVQAVAGMVLVFRRLRSAGPVVSANLLARELQLFAESEQRGRVLEKIGHSALLSHCHSREGMVEFVVKAMDEREDRHYAETLPLPDGTDLLNDSVQWVSDRPCKNMGLPWGFTIMALN